MSPPPSPHVYGTPKIPIPVSSVLKINQPPPTLPTMSPPPSPTGLEGTPRIPIPTASTLPQIRWRHMF
jgi:hypothetical protein